MVKIKILLQIKLCQNLIKNFSWIVLESELYKNVLDYYHLFHSLKLFLISKDSILMNIKKKTTKNCTRFNFFHFLWNFIKFCTWWNWKYINFTPKPENLLQKLSSPLFCSTSFHPSLLSPYLLIWKSAAVQWEHLKVKITSTLT